MVTRTKIHAQTRWSAASVGCAVKHFVAELVKSFGNWFRSTKVLTTSATLKHHKTRAVKLFVAKLVKSFENWLRATKVLTTSATLKHHKTRAVKHFVAELVKSFGDWFRPTKVLTTSATLKHHKTRAVKHFVAKLVKSFGNWVCATKVLTTSATLKHHKTRRKNTSLRCPMGCVAVGIACFGFISTLSAQAPSWTSEVSQDSPAGTSRDENPAEEELIQVAPSIALFSGVVQRAADMQDEFWSQHPTRHDHARDESASTFVPPFADGFTLASRTQDATDDLLGSGGNGEEPVDQDDVAADKLRKSELEMLMKPISGIEVQGPFPSGRVPVNQAAKQREMSSMVIMATGAIVPQPDRYTAGFSHHPLYFEQRNLERCGNHYGCLQNAVSGMEFLYNVKTLPYHLAATPAGQCVGSPGDCQSCEVMPKRINPFPLEPRGVTLQAAAVAGFVLLLQ